MIIDPVNRLVSSLYWRAQFADRGLRSHWRDIDAFKLLSPSQARRVLARRLQSQIRYFGMREDALPEWREATRVTDPEEFWTIWQSLPILTKEDFRGRFHPTEMRCRFGLQGVASSTGGSTGEPTPFFHDEAMRLASFASGLYCRLQFGWRPGMPVIAVWGSDRDIGKQGQGTKARRVARLYNNWLVEGYRLGTDTTDRVLGLIRRFRSVAIYGFTSLLEFVARQVLDRGEMPEIGRVRAAWNGGEMLSDVQANLFRRAFGSPLLNLYGGRELSAMAYQASERASLQVLRPLVFVEIVDDRGRPASPGEAGRLIWTSTVCRGSPFLRYEIGDVGTADTGDQDESGICALTSLQGRSGGLLKLPSGRVIGGLFWNHLFKDYPEIRQFQVALIGARRVELRLKGLGFDPGGEERLLAVLKEILDGAEVRISWVDRIPLTPQGKLVQVVREEVGTP